MRNVTIAGLALLLTACGGGSDSSNEQNKEIPAPPSATMPVGVWTGTSIHQETQISYEVAALVSPSGEVRFIADDGEQVKTNITLDGKSFSGAALSYDVDGLLIAAGTVSGSYTDSSISADASIGNIIISRVSLTVDPITSLGASFNQLAGTYATEDQLTSIVFDGAGKISGSDADGCIYSGGVVIPDPSINIYEISLVVENCSIFNDTYAGLGALGEQDANGFTPFVFQVDNEKYSLTDVLYK